MTGQVLAEYYEIQRQLGKQSGRQTLLVRDLRTQELAIAKLLFLGPDFEWQDLKLFEREAETLKALFHPGIPRYLDYFEIDEPDKKGFALIQSYIEGKTLEEHLRSGRTFSEAEVKQLAKSLLEILTYLHKCEPPVIHRDIKPSNILLNNRSSHSVGQVHLVDFGSVQNLAAREGGTITVVGTYGYMPPEQFGGRTVPASDLYSLGATLIYLVTGLHPTELPHKDFRIEFHQASKLSLAFADWLGWMTEPSLDKRLTSADDALEALEKPRSRKKADWAIATPGLKAYAQPLNSEVILKKNTDYLEIILPPKGFGFGAIAMLSVVVPLLLMGFPSLGISSVGILAKILKISFFMVCIKHFIFALFKRFRLRIDRQQITFTNELFGLKWNRFRPTERQDISHLILIRHSDVNLLDEKNLWTPQLVIKAGKQKYILDEKERLSASEINWLACELSHWLGLPITPE